MITGNLIEKPKSFVDCCVGNNLNMEVVLVGFGCHTYIKKAVIAELITNFSEYRFFCKMRK